MPEHQPRTYPLSPNQQFLLMFDQGPSAGPFGPLYNIVSAHELRGDVDTEVLRRALAHVVERHEALRTVVVRGEEPHQAVHAAGPARLDVVDLRGEDPAGLRERTEQVLIGLETSGRAADELPLLAATLVTHTAEQHVLALVVHHVAADEWAMQLLLRDVLAVYGDLVAGRGPAGAESVPQFGAYSERAAARAGGPAAERAAEHWGSTLAEATITPLETTYARSEGRAKDTAWLRFTLDRETVRAVDDLAKRTRATPFIVLLAAYGRFVAERTGAQDPTVMTFSSGRSEPAVHETVGSFFTFLPLHLALAGTSSLEQAVVVTRGACLRAYQHERPFGEVLQVAPGLMAQAATDRGAICAFQVYRPAFPDTGTLGGLGFAPFVRSSTHPAGVDIPDGAMWHVDFPFSGDAEAPVRLGYNTNLYGHDEMAALAQELAAHLRTELAGTDPQESRRSA